MDPIMDLPAEALALGLRIRAAEEADQPFLREVQVQARWAEFDAAGWPDDQRRAFLEQQADLQHHHYSHFFDDVDYGVLERAEDGEKAGRLYLARRAEPDGLRIVDIALMPDWRNRGLGGAIIRALQDEARASGRPLTIHVERHNPALRLYERSGFTAIEDKGVYLLMGWRG